MARVGLGVGGTIVAISTVARATIALFSPAKADTSVSAPFTWQGVTWCPSYRESAGCGKAQKNGTGSSAAFYPSQVVQAGSSDSISLKMDQSASRTGALNTQRSETWNGPARLSEQINLPCNGFGKIENWPAFWLVTTGSWPAGEEIDVMGGLNGSAASHYHYLSRSGASSVVEASHGDLAAAVPTLMLSTGQHQRLRSTTTANKWVTLLDLKSASRLLPAQCMSLTTTLLHPFMVDRQRAM